MFKGTSDAIEDWVLRGTERHPDAAVLYVGAGVIAALVVLLLSAAVLIAGLPVVVWVVGLVATGRWDWPTWELLRGLQVGWVLFLIYAYYTPSRGR